MLNLAEKSVVVTGGAGFLGRHVVAELAARGCTPVVPRSRDFDLTQADAVAELYRRHRPQRVPRSTSP